MVVFRELLKAELLQLVSKVSSGTKGGRHSNIRLFETDASNKEKFSRHVVVRIEGFSFKNIEHVGFFVKQFCKNVSVKSEGIPSKSDLLLVQKSKEVSGVFIDQSVYTITRNFRLVLSAKFKDINQRHLYVYLVRTNTTV